MTKTDFIIKLLSTFPFPDLSFSTTAIKTNLYKEKCVYLILSTVILLLSNLSFPLIMLITAYHNLCWRNVLTLTTTALFSVKSKKVSILDCLWNAFNNLLSIITLLHKKIFKNKPYSLLLKEFFYLAIVATADARRLRLRLDLRLR